MQSNPSETLFLIRTLEDRLQELCLSGELGADLHMTKGQEAIAMGVCLALQPQDMVACHHRMISWAVSRGLPLEPFVAELMGKQTGMAGGLAGEMHLSSLEHGFAHSFQLVGTVVPFAAGVAWALRNHRKTDGIAVAVFGDAATANGQWHEGVNLAAVMGLPVLLVCEDNHLAGNVRPDKYNPAWVAQRARGYGIEYMTIDGNDLPGVTGAASRAVAYLRAESRPFLLVCDTTRLGRHKQGQGDGRSKEEMAKLAERDPLLRLDIPEERRAAIRAKVDEVIERARRAPEPALG